MRKQRKLLGILLAASLVFSGCGSGKLMGLYVGTRGGSGYEFQAVSAARVSEILAETLS